MKPKLAGTFEAAMIIGVSDTRVRQLSRDDPNFPSKIAVLRCGPIWEWEALEVYATTPRPHGRPWRH